jgi:ketosteroid isomerase-like protein
MLTGDDDVMRSLFESDAEIWHNTDGAVQTVEENLKLGRWLRRKVPDVAFTEIRHTVTEDGFIQRHRMTGTPPGGGMLDVASCLLATLGQDGKIQRLEEYLDSAALVALRATAESGHGSH